MNITVKLFAGLRRYIPDGIGREGMVLTLPPSSTPHQVLDRLNVPRREAHLLLINGVFIEPEKREQAVFRDGDVLAVWPPVAGG